MSLQQGKAEYTVLWKVKILLLPFLGLYERDTYSAQYSSICGPALGFFILDADLMSSGG